MTNKEEDIVWIVILNIFFMILASFITYFFNEKFNDVKHHNLWIKTELIKLCTDNWWKYIINWEYIKIGYCNYRSKKIYDYETLDKILIIEKYDLHSKK
jgi:hypothetical protein